ncbi:MAG: mechanosensitive ion channel [Gammaproteobacteria bacterium]|nr:mechanosensitive ion channel [Gammaproteobacteria bacterium]
MKTKIEQIVDDIIARGEMNKNEYQEILKQIYSTPFVGKVEKEQIERIKKHYNNKSLKLLSNPILHENKKIDYIKSILFYSLGLLFLLVLGMGMYRHFSLDSLQKNNVRIAVVGGLSSPRGEDVIKAIQLAVDKNNKKKSEENATHAEIVLFDDQNDPIKAKQIAEQIAKDSSIHAVIGHFTSDTASEAGKIYKDAKIPAITASATSDKVTSNNPWYFRSVAGNKLQADYAAVYLHHVLNMNNIHIIHSENNYANNFADHLEKKWKTNFNLSGLNRWEVSGNGEFNKIIKTLKQDTASYAIFLLLPKEEAARFLVRLRDNDINAPVLGGELMAEDSFVTLLKTHSTKGGIDKYIEGLYALTHSLKEVTNHRTNQFVSAYLNKYAIEPSNFATNYYDAAAIVLAGAKNGSSKKTTTGFLRNQIQQYLASLNSSKSQLEGVTGGIFFDREGSANKTVSIGKFKYDEFIPSFVQLTHFHNVDEITNIEERVAKHQIIKIQNSKKTDFELYLKTDFVFAGVELIDLKHLDIRKNEAELEFYIWFRYKGTLPVGEIEVLNSIGPVTFKEEITEKNDYYNYKLFHVSGKFKTDYGFPPLKMNETSFGISFRHKTLSDDKLRYVVDRPGLGLTKKTTLKSMLSKRDFHGELKKWKITNVEMLTDNAYYSSLGDPVHMRAQHVKPSYSRFGFHVEIHKKKISLWNSLPREIIYDLTFFSFLLGLLKILFTIRRGPLQNKKLNLLINFTLAVTFFLSLQNTLIYFIYSNNYRFLESLLLTKFSLLWWFSAAYFTNKAIDVFLWKQIEKNTGRLIPSLARNFTATIIWSLAMFAIIGFVFGFELTGLLATSGVVVMIIGLAIQMNVSNIFSGMALNIERPYRTGDWIQIDGKEEGKVLDISWRSTRIQTRDECVILIPNSRVAESEIKNFSFPNDNVERYFFIYIDPKHSPERVKELLINAALTSEGISHTPSPYSRFKGMEGSAVKYGIYYVVSNYATKFAAEETLWRNIWSALNLNGITPVIPRKEIAIRQDSPFYDFKEMKPHGAIHQIELFKEMDDLQKDFLGALITEVKVSPGTNVLEENQISDGIYFIKEGVIAIYARLIDEQKSIEISQLAPGQSFGEVSVLLGEKLPIRYVPKTQLCMYRVSKNAIKELLENEPQLLDLFVSYLKNILKEGKGQSIEVLDHDFDSRIKKTFGAV